MSRLPIVYREVSREVFLDWLVAAQLARGDHGLCVSFPEDHSRLFLASDGMSGFALDGNYLGSVFSQCRGRLGEIVNTAKRLLRARGHAMVRLDCFAGLEPVYERHGFRRTWVKPFDWNFAPDGWRKDMGEPDVVFMTASVWSHVEPPRVAA